MWHLIIYKHRIRQTLTPLPVKAIVTHLYYSFKWRYTITRTRAIYIRSRVDRSDQITNLRIVMLNAMEQRPSFFFALWTIGRSLIRYPTRHFGWPRWKWDSLGLLSAYSAFVNSTYRRQKARVKAAGTALREFRVRRGVTQGCVLSPSLFNILAEMVMREVLDGFEDGLQMGGRRVTNLRYTGSSDGAANTSWQTRQCIWKVWTADKRR